MAIPAWFWPPFGGTARGAALVPFGAGMVVPDWTRQALWPFSGGAFGTASIGSGQYGFGSAASDSASGGWFTTWDGAMFHLASGSPLPAVTTMPGGRVYVGTAACAGSGFAAAASGQVYTSAGASLGAFPFPIRSLVASGTTMAALMPSSGIGTMNAANGAIGFVALPAGMTVPSCIALASGAPMAVGGWAAAPPLSGAAAAAMDPQDATRMFAVGSGFALQWIAPAALADAWSQAQAVTGLANLTAAAWSPDGTKLLACSPAAGDVQAFSYAAGSVALVQTLSVSGACSVAIAGDSVHALVAQSGQSQATPLTYSSSWSIGTTVGGLAGIVVVAPYGASGAVAAVSGGLQYLNLTGGVWSSGAAVALPFVPTALTVDAYAQVYAAGSGAVAMVSGAAMVASGTWSGGAATSIAVQQGRIVVAVPGDGLLRVFGLASSGALTQQSSMPLAIGTTGLALSETTLFAMQASGTALYGFSGSPYALTPALSGIAGFWNGSAWTTKGLGVGHLPAAIGLDASGGAWVATVQNTLWHVASDGTVLSSGILQQYPGQAQTVPLCSSALLVASGGVYVATSIPGVLVEAA